MDVAFHGVVVAAALLFSCPAFALLRPDIVAPRTDVVIATVYEDERCDFYGLPQDVEILQLVQPLVVDEVGVVSPIAGHATMSTPYFDCHEVCPMRTPHLGCVAPTALALGCD